MRYRILELIRIVYLKLANKDCDTCKHYNGKFGDDYCFECLGTIKAVNYEFRG